MNEIFLDKFTVLDFALYSGTELSGESYYCSARLSGELDSRGFVYDFGPAKQLLKNTVDEAFDHKLLFSSNILLQGLDLCSEQFFYRAPKQSFAYIPGNILDRKCLEQAIAHEVLRVMPKTVKFVEIELLKDLRFEREAHYAYTHGLPLHEGNCQRLLHGHRNPIEVFINEKRDSKREQFIADLWQNAHFTQRRIITKGIEFFEGQKDGRRNLQIQEMISMGYHSSQGEFSLSIPGSKIVLMSEEPSVENIARLAYGVIQDHFSNNDGLMVKAYEGLNKGAICRSL